MKNLFLKSDAEEILSRIVGLVPNQQPLWGKMNVAQMITHCSRTLEVATGSKDLPRVFMGWFIGPLFKSSFYNDKPLPKNSPTAEYFIVKDEKNMMDEKEILIDKVRLFHEGGESNCTTKPHAFFGKLTPEQWGKGMYKHLDHHLKQFGA